MDQESIEKAKHDYNEWIVNFLKNLTFFKKSAADLSIFDECQSFSIYSSYKEKCLKALDDGYDHIAKYWCDSYLTTHIAFMFNKKYDELCLEYRKDTSINLAKALNNAMGDTDKYKLSLIKELKVKYP
jgi:hypothetical protein